jgi:hypothetical protein
MTEHDPHPVARPRGVPMVLRMAALGLSVFGAALMAPGRFAPQAEAQTLPASGVGTSTLVLRMDARVRAEVAAALAAMPDRELSLAYARIHATFRDWLGRDDLSVARALIDYASLAEAELRRRSIALPPGTESAERMNLAYELVL